MGLDILSIILYVITFLGGIYIGVKNNQKAKTLYQLWLYLFICFGYMTGSDWRIYELHYNEGLHWWQYISEPFSWIVLTYMPKIIPDYWLFVGLCKCLYLLSFTKLARKLSEYPIAVAGCSVPMFLAFLLVDNPLRYMLALIPLNFAIIRVVDIYEKGFRLTQLFRIVSLIIVASLFHNTCIVYLVILPLIIVCGNISRINRFGIFISFLVVVILTSNVDLLNAIKETVVSSMTIIGDTKNYSKYDFERTESLFALGNILKIGFLVIILLSRDAFIGKIRHSKLIFTCTIFYFFLDRFTLIIEAGYRLVIPLQFFYCLYIIGLISLSSRYGKIIIVYLFLQFTSIMWGSFVYIPYSNSIPYILNKHKTYNERYYNNFKALENRTGKDQSYDIED